MNGFLFGRKKSHERALEWFHRHRVTDEGVIIHTRTPKPYPEVTGYFIPTLYDWGEVDAARSCASWLLSIQHADGAFPAPDGTPYSFDTGQIMRGLCASLDDVEGAREGLTRACDWILTQIEPCGRLGTPSTDLWDEIADDLIHTYVLAPLQEAGRRLGRPEYVAAAQKVLAYYKAKPELVPFNRLAHFHAYIMEALVELGEDELARQGMAEVAGRQRLDGSIPAYRDVNWICSTAIAQYAVVWYRLGERERADRALRYMEKIQNRSGGWNGSYGKGASYISGAEISWAVKYFLDACRLREKARSAQMSVRATRRG